MTHGAQEKGSNPIRTPSAAVANPVAQATSPLFHYPSSPSSPTPSHTLSDPIVSTYIPINSPSVHSTQPFTAQPPHPQGTPVNTMSYDPYPNSTSVGPYTPLSATCPPSGSERQYQSTSRPSSWNTAQQGQASSMPDPYAGSQVSNPSYSLEGHPSSTPANRDPYSQPTGSFTIPMDYCDLPPIPRLPRTSVGWQLPALAVPYNPPASTSYPTLDQLRTYFSMRGNPCLFFQAKWFSTSS